MCKKVTILWGNSLIVLCLFMFIFNDGCSATHVQTAALKTAEQKSNSVEMKIYLATIDEWLQTIDSVFKKALTEEANKYCLNLAACGVIQSVNFQESDIQLLAWPEVVSVTGGTGSNLKVVYCLNFPASVENATKTDFVLNGQSLLEVSSNIRTKIYTTTDFSVIGLTWGSVVRSYLPRADFLLNAILVPVAICVTIGFIILVFVLRHWSQKKSEAHKREIKAKRLDKRGGYKTGRSTSIDESFGVKYHNFSNGTTKATTVNENGSRQKQQRKDVLNHLQNPGHPRGRLPPLPVKLPKYVKKGNSVRPQQSGNENAAYVHDKQELILKTKQTIQEETETETETQTETNDDTQSESTVTNSYPNPSNFRPNNLYEEPKMHHYEQPKTHNKTDTEYETQTETSTSEDESETETETETEASSYKNQKKQ